MVLHADLDNTIIYSYRHDIGEQKRNVELYQGREISFITEETYVRLRELKEKLLIVPTSTRTVEQYQRIQLGVGSFSCALVCNGGVLLLHGRKDEAWYETSLRLIEESREELQKAHRLLAHDPRRSFELRFIENLFLFTKCEDPGQVVADLNHVLQPQTVEVFHNGVKVYVVPVNLSKGKAVERFRDYISDDMVFAAGDSAFDLSMLRAADVGFAPYGFSRQYPVTFPLWEAPEGELFSEAWMRECLRQITDQSIPT